MITVKICHHQIEDRQVHCRFYAKAGKLGGADYLGSFIPTAKQFDGLRKASDYFLGFEPEKRNVRDVHGVGERVS